MSQHWAHGNPNLSPTFDDVNITVVPFVTEDNEANPAFRYTKLYSLKTGSRWPVSETIGGVSECENINLELNVQMGSL